MFDWPDLELTDFEKKHVAKYRTTLTQAQVKAGVEPKPGVLKRTYRIGTFSPIPLPDIGQAAPVFGLTLQTSRRSRIFGLTFTGNLDAWFLKIQDAAGELYTAQNRQQLLVTQPGQVPEPKEGCLVSSMIPGSIYNAEAWIGSAIPSPFLPVSNAPMLIDPNWVLYPNTTLQFSVQLAQNWQIVFDNPGVFETADGLKDQLNLVIGVHLWEFPGMDGGPE